MLHGEQMPVEGRGSAFARDVVEVDGLDLVGRYVFEVLDLAFEIPRQIVLLLALPEWVRY